jgi:1-acyl-sn-glycerol-3-phosphate acyltransferase
MLRSVLVKSRKALAALLSGARLAMSWCFCVLGGIIMLVFLCPIGYIKIRGQKLPRQVPPQGLLIVSNHPWFLEPAVLVLMFFPRFLFAPRQWMPWSVPDARKLNNWVINSIAMRRVFVRRENARASAEALARLGRIISHGQIGIVFAEGGSTNSRFNNHRPLIESPAGGGQVREFRRSVGIIFQNACPVFLPVYVFRGRSWWPGRKNSFMGQLCRSTTVVLGKASRVPAGVFTGYCQAHGATPGERVVHYLQTHVLRLADQFVPSQKAVKARFEAAKETVSSR